MSRPEIRRAAEPDIIAQALCRSEGLEPQSHALYTGGREILWVKSLDVPRS